MEYQELSYGEGSYNSCRPVFPNIEHSQTFKIIMNKKKKYIVIIIFYMIYTLTK